MVKGLIIPADSGRPVESREFTGLDDYQKGVGGWIEAVDIPSLGITVYVNEEGIMLNLPFNSRATFMWWYEWPLARQKAMLLGDAVVVGLPDRNGASTDVPRRTQRLLQTPTPYAVVIEVQGKPHHARHPFPYDDYFEAVVWAMILVEQLAGNESVKVVALERVLMDEAGDWSFVDDSPPDERDTPATEDQK